MVELEKIESDMEIMRQRINAFGILNAEYQDFVDNLSFPSGLSDKCRPARIIWSCWLQGIDSAPEIVQACHKSLWSKYPEYEKILITSENFAQYIEIPPYILKKWREGILAIRLTVDACLQPCLMRADNRLDLSGLQACPTRDLAAAIADYIKKL